MLKDKHVWRALGDPDLSTFFFKKHRCFNSVVILLNKLHVKRNSKCLDKNFEKKTLQDKYCFSSSLSMHFLRIQVNCSVLPPQKNCHEILRPFPPTRSLGFLYRCFRFPDQVLTHCEFMSFVVGL